MTAVTTSDRTPSGTIITPNDVFLEGGPEFWFGGVPRYSPDSDGFYWGITGIDAKPAYKLGCYTDFRWRDNVQMTEVRCDTIGVTATIQKRNYLEFTCTLMSLLPLKMLKNIIHGGTVTITAEGAEKMGLGDINNAEYHLCFLSRVYDQTALDFVTITGHRCQFVDSWEIAMTYGAPWTLGIKMRLHADDTKPAAQRFATVIRLDPSMVP